MGAVTEALSPLAYAPSPMAATSFATSSQNVDQRDTDLFFFMSKYQSAPKGSNEQFEANQKFNEVISQRNQMDNSVKHLGELLFGVEKGEQVMQSVRPTGQPLVDNWDCLKSYVKMFEAHCGELTSYGKKHIRGIANICNAGKNEVDANIVLAALGDHSVGEASSTRQPIRHPSTGSNDQRPTYSIY